MRRKPALALLIRRVARMLPGLEDTWGAAMAAEYAHIPTRRERASYVISSVRGLVMITVARRLRRWHENGFALFTMFALGVLIAVVDLRAGSRWPLRITVLLACAAAGWIAPRAAGLAGALLALGLPVAIVLSGFHGPYAIDRGDIWLPLVPAVSIATGFSWLRLHLTSHRV